MTMTPDEIIEVVQAFKDGCEIECFHLGAGSWYPVLKPKWDFSNYIYRVKLVKPSIDWSHVHSDYKWMARNKLGAMCLFTAKPILECNSWSGRGWRCNDSLFRSYKPGTVDWEDSLIERPEDE